MPKNLKKFALTCPHWQEGMDQPPEGFVTLRKKMNQNDVQVISQYNCDPALVSTVGYDNFASVG